MRLAPILPPACIGIVGGGQLGRMLAIAARRMGYGVAILDPQESPPAAAIADDHLRAEFGDVEALRELARRSQVVTFEFENVPADALAALESGGTTPVRPSARVLETCRHRAREKQFLSSNGIPVAPYRVVGSSAEAGQAAGELGGAGILKTAEFGYDGKGQRRVASADDAQRAFEELGTSSAVLEAVVPFERELSILCARGADGDVATYPLAENLHENHILATSLMPAVAGDALIEDARAIARKIARQLDLVGLVAVELFDTRGELIVNELAPRPHNSAHVTIEACATDQFEQHVRAICGLPLGPTDIVAPSAMVNLLGDLWSDGEPDWSRALHSSDDVHLHLYGKTEARVGRKMGHLTARGVDAASAVAIANRAKERLN